MDKDTEFRCGYQIGLYNLRKLYKADQERNQKRIFTLKVVITMLVLLLITSNLIWVYVVVK